MGCSSCVRGILGRFESSCHGRRRRGRTLARRPQRIRGTAGGGPGDRARLPARGRGGYPLLLVHGWPETKRIWWRNIGPLAEAGFEVIVPDLRGFGDSGLAPDGHYDLAAHARDLHALVHDVLGHERVRRPAATSAAA